MSGTDGPEAWIVCGAPGSGKSVLGRELATELDATLIDQDVATGPLTRVISRLVDAAEGDLDDPRVRAAVGVAPYEVVFDLASANIALGRTVVIVAPFTSGLGSERAVSDVRSRLAPAPLRVVRTSCPPDERLRRLAARGAARDRRKLEQPLPTERERTLAVAHRAIDTTLPMTEQLASARRAPIVAPPRG